MKSGTP